MQYLPRKRSLRSPVRCGNAEIQPRIFIWTFKDMAEDQKSEQRSDEAVRGEDLLTRIAIDCLKCGHCTSIARGEACLLRYRAPLLAGEA